LAWLFDVTLNLMGGSRYSVGWYMGRINSLITSSVVLVALLYEINRLYQQVQESLKNQQELNRIKDQFVSIASHELRTPLTTVQGYTQLLQRNLTKLLTNEPDLTDSVKQALTKNAKTSEQILHQSARMNDLISRLLDFSRVQAGRLELNLNEHLDIVQLLKNVIEQQKVVLKNHDLAIDLPPQEVLIVGDEARLEQVFNNLLTNATKYSPPNTYVTVTILPPTALAEVTISVRDEGVGITPQDQVHIFEQFYRAHSQERTTDGLGLGLFITQEIVKQHGGRIWVESTPDKGSTFFVTLLLSTPASQLETQLTPLTVEPV
jgi:signal transduction histidine kinase